jgi:hypothetical protein
MYLKDIINMSENNKMRPGKNHPGPGRPKGTPNRISGNLREAIQDSFNKLGGEKWLLELAKKDPRTFAGLLAKILPDANKSELPPIPTISISFVESHTTKLDDDTLTTLKVANDKEDTSL